MQAFSIKGRWPTLFLRLYWIGLVALFAAGLAIRFSLPSLPLMDPDTVDYLYPSVQLFATHTYVPSWRTFLYPSFVTLVLGISPHLNSLSYVQHILGVGTAALIVLIFFRSRVFFPPGQFLDWITRAIALMAAYFFLFSRSTITLEHSIRPEALFPTACALTMLAGLEFSRRVFFEKRTDWLASLWALLLIIFAVGTYYLKPAWGLAIGTSLLPLAFACMRIPSKGAWKLGIPLLGFLVAFIIFVLPGHILQKRAIKKDAFLPGTLLCTHAEFLQDIIQRDALRLPPESRKRTDLLKFVQDIHSAIQNPSIRRYGLSINPDDLMYRGPLDRLTHRLDNYHISFSRFCYYYYFRAWVEHPVLMLKKVIKQIVFFYTPMKVNVYQIGTDLDLPEKYGRIPKFLHDIQYPDWQPLKDYQKRLQNSNLAKKDTLPYEMQWMVLLSNNTFLPILILSLLGVAVVFKDNRFTQLRPAALCLLYLASFNFANCLTISLVHMMNVSRYHFNQITMSLISQGFEILFLIALIQACLQHRNNRESEKLI